MDPIFQSLVLNQPGNGSSDGSKPDGSGDGSGRRQQPRPSRYAQLIPREALRQPPTPSVVNDDGRGDGASNLKKKKKKHQRHKDKEGAGAVAVGGRGREASKLPSMGGGSDANAIATDANSSSVSMEGNHIQSGMETESIRVYRLDGATSQFELLPEEDYDLVYHSDNEIGDGGPDGENGINIREGESDKDKSDEGNSEVKDDPMDVDEKEDGATPAREEGSHGELLSDEEDTIYIVKGSTPSSQPTFNNIQLYQEMNDTEPSSDSDDIPAEALDEGYPFPGDSVPLHPQKKPDLKSKEASATASTLARALVSRTEGFEKMRSGYIRMLEEERSSEDKNSEEKKKKKEKKDSRLTSAPGPSSSSSATPGKGKEELKLPKPKEGDNADYETGKGGENEREPQLSSATFVQSKKLITSLQPSANVLDGDSPHTILQLSKMRRWQESQIEPCMQGMELDDWEDGIDWEGATSGEDEKEQEKEKDPNTMDVDEKIKDFKPPKPRGGHPKRARRSPLEYEDPIELLLEPRNPRLEALDLAAAVDWDGAYDSDDPRRFDDDGGCDANVPLILQSSVAGRSVASLLAPCAPSCRPPPFESHPSYQARYDREAASEVTSTADLAAARPGPGMPGDDVEKLEKFKEARQRKREQMAKDKQSRVTEVMSALSLKGTGRRITSSLMGPGGAERTGRPSRHALGGSSSAHDAEYVEQLELVYNHTLVKPDLTLSEYRQFHRPRLPILVVNPTCPWQFQTRVITEKKRSARGGAKGGSGAMNTDGSTVGIRWSAGSKAQNKIRNEADLSAAAGDLVVIEYSEERPPLLMTKGMTCRIVNYYRGDRSRCPISAGGGDRPLRKRHGDKAASAATSNAPTSGPSNRVERPPRLVGPNQYVIKSAADLIGISSIKKKKKSKEAMALEAKKAKENAIDVLPDGVTEILHQKIHGPFIGEVEEGKAQTGLISNLFAAPMFRHESEPTDFLMILGQVKEKSKSSINDVAMGGLGVVLRPFPPNIYCAGQTEPRVKVFAPNTNDEKKFINAFVPYQVSKNIERKEIRDGSGLTFDDIKDRLFANTTIPHGQLRIRIKQVANFERSNNGIWSLKHLGQDGFPGVEALGRKVSPEGVAAYESQCAAIRRLQDLGVNELYSGGNTVQNVAAVMIFLNGSVQAAMERRLKMKKVVEMKKRKKDPRLIYFEKAFDVVDAEYKEVKKRQEIAKFIYEELQLSPWNISGEFIDMHKRAVGGAMMKLTGIGDPSGVGEAYNFLREADSRQKSSTSNSDGALNAQIKKITGTQNDLRKLTMKQMASLLRSYGMKDKQIGVLKRWDRVHVIRDLSTKAASDGMGDEMERFARGEKLRLSDQRQNYKERIQEIWRRQIVALTAADAGNEASAGSDLAISSVKDTNDVCDGADAAKEKEDESDSDSEDDDFADMLEMEMANTGEANRLMNAQLRDSGGVGGLGNQELSRDAREFAALQRQREEERAIQEGFDQKGSGSRMSMKPKKKFKVIRRKITTTRPDGTQTVTFEFIVNREKVEEIMTKKKKEEADEKKRIERKKKKNVMDSDSHNDPVDTCVGHAMFEDDDNDTKDTKTRKSSLKVKLRKTTHVVERKRPGPKKASHSKITNTIKHSRAQAQENRKKKRIKQQEEADLYKNHVKKGTSNRKERGSARERMPHVVLAGRLESVRSEVEKRKNVGPFLKPVSRTMFPQYYEKIHEPIDLQTIREKNRKYDYNTADKFVEDFALMKNNAIKFNLKGSLLANEAVEIYEFVRRTIEQNREEFDEMEDAVKNQMNGKKKKKGRSKLSDSSSNISKATTMKTASVVLDGVSAEVNVGDFDFGQGGSDSDDS